MVRRIIGHLLCRLNYHRWWSCRRYRCCQRCDRREVWTAYGWVERAYPFNTDPTIDPAPCVSADGDPGTVGFEVWWGRQCEKWRG